MVFSYRACSDEQSYDAFPMADSHRSCACRGRYKHGAIALIFFYRVCSKRSFFIFLNKHEAMSRSSLRHCELSHRVIARAGTWTDVGALLVEEETMGGADAFLSGRL
nr:hypothetical protein [Evansella caseinilytica]